MIPIGDNIPSRSFPFVTIGLIAVNIVVFIYELSLGPRLPALVNTYALIPQQVTLTALFTDPGDLSNRFFGSTFLHGGWLHLGGNMLYLWIFGDNVEDRFGHFWFLVFYFVAGFFAMAAHVWSDPLSSQPVIGASGAIAGVLGAYLVMFPGARVFIVIPLLLFFPVISVPAIIVLGFWFFQQLFNVVGALNEAGGSNVAWWAHIGGFAAGMILVRLFLRKQRKYIFK
jgi:membrane associated rhomboid family serine protease